MVAESRKALETSEGRLRTSQKLYEQLDAEKQQLLADQARHVALFSALSPFGSPLLALPFWLSPFGSPLLALPSAQLHPTH